MKVLISSCVYGENVRWNSTNREYADIHKWAKANDIELVPVCPEDELFGTPRKPIRLEQVGDGGVVGWMGGKDVYRDLMDKSFEITDRHSDAVGFIGVAGSPSCGVSVGVKNRGSTMKAPMHLQSPFPTTEINSLRTEAHRKLFLERVKKYESRRRSSN